MKQPPTAKQLFGEASEHFRAGAYTAAAEQYRELLDQHPFSEHSEEAELKIAHAEYLNGSCPEAVASFTDFQRRHPTSPYLPFVGFLLGQCYEQRMRAPDRDQSASQNAHAYYLAVTQQYPTSPFADLAWAQIQHCRETLAKNEMIVADFYSGRGNVKAAEFRLLDLVNRFNDTDVAGDALYKLGNLYGEQGNEGQAALAYAAVAHHHPDNGVAERARRALAESSAADDLPAGDPLAVLQAQSGRSRSLALTQVVQVPLQDETRQSPGPGFGGFPTGGTGPFGGTYGRGY